MAVFLLTSSPYSQNAQMALAKIYQSNTTDMQIFLYADAVQFAHRAIWLPSDMPNPIQDFQAFLQKNALIVHVCVSTALARGISDKSNAMRHTLTDGEGHPLNTLHDCCQLVGLGELAMLLHQTKQVYQF